MRQSPLHLPTALAAMSIAIGMLLLPISNLAWAQWEPAVDLEAGSIRDFLVREGKIFVATRGGGVFLSEDSGHTWKTVNNGLTNTIVWELVDDGEQLFAATSEGVFRTANDGTQWNPANKGLPRSVASIINTSVQIGSDRFVGTDEGVFRTPDDGTTWAAVNTGLPEFAYIEDLVSLDRVLYAATTYKGVFSSTNRGANWESTGSFDGYTCCLEVVDGRLFLGTSEGIYRSTDKGENWEATLPMEPDPRVGFESLVLKEETLLAATDLNKVFLSADLGENWRLANAGLPANLRIQDLVVSQKKLFAGTDQVLFKFKDGDESWTAIDSSLADWDVEVLAASGMDLFAGSWESGIMHSADGGATWRARNEGLPAVERVESLKAIGNGLVVVTPDSSGESDYRLFRSLHGESSWTEGNFAFYENGHLNSISVLDTQLVAVTETRAFVSDDLGSTWAEIDVNIPEVQQLLVVGSNILAITETGVFLSEDKGRSWATRDSGLPEDLFVVGAIDSYLYAQTGDGDYFSKDLGRSWDSVDLNLQADVWMEGFQDRTASIGSTVFVASDEGLFRSSNGTDWTPLAFGKRADVSVKALAIIDETLIVATETGVFQSPDLGDTWSKINSGLPEDPRVLSLAVDGARLYAGTAHSGVFQLSDVGDRWLSMRSGLPPSIDIRSLAFSGGELFAGTDKGLYRSDNQGRTWSRFDAMTVGSNILALAAIESNLFAAKDYSNIYRSSNGGEEWTAVSPNFRHWVVLDFEVARKDLYAIVYEYGIHRSTDSGGSWEEVGSEAAHGGYIRSFIAFGEKLLIGGAHGVSQSTDNGVTWKVADSGIPPNTFAHTLMTNGDLVFAGTDRGVFLSIDGMSWTPISEGLPENTEVLALAATQATVFAGTTDGEIWRLRLSEVTAKPDH